MHARIPSFSVHGIDAVPVQVEVDSYEAASAETAVWTIVGLGDASIKESRERVKAALKNSGIYIAQKRITVNLAPADLRKVGSHYDLAIALAVLASVGRLDAARLTRIAAIGELGLDGSIRPAVGALPMAIGARDVGVEAILAPPESAAEAAIVEGVTAIPVENLAQALRYLLGEEAIAPAVPSMDEAAAPESIFDFADVVGQESAKRALEIAAAGGHNVLFVGPPGSGKTMLARRLPTILPDLSFEEAIETTKIHSIAGVLAGRSGLVRQRPFRAPHHTASAIALVGGGTTPRPGEVSLAHNGVLFLDELPEFNRTTLEVLRQPLEDGIVQISRAQASVLFPARFNLIAAMNPCPCGYATDPAKRCTCHPTEIARYLSRISGPLLDRIDLHIDVAAVPVKDLQDRPRGEGSAVVRARVLAARAIQAQRFQGRQPSIHCNAQMAPADMNKHCAITDPAKRVLETSMAALQLSARAYDRIRKVARTIADLDGAEVMDIPHISEAVGYRSLDRMQG